jgi:hypothetical protein
MDLDFEDKFRNCIKKIAQTGELYAEAKGQSWQMQEMKSSVLASMMQNLPNMAVSKAEITAKASLAYVQHLEETAKAIKKELQLKSQYEMWKASFEALRSLSSLEKATRNLSE